MPIPTDTWKVKYINTSDQDIVVSISSGTDVDITIDWGGVHQETYTTIGDKSYTLPAGEHEINIWGSITDGNITFNSTTSRQRLTEIVEPLKGIDGITQFYQTFQGCWSLTSIPAGLFDYYAEIAGIWFVETFFGCISLTSIPAGLFDNHTLVSGFGFLGTFEACSSLTSIPEGLFDYNTLVSTHGFGLTFAGCSSLTSIPEGLFDNNTLVSVNGFHSTFAGCSSLTSIPEGLFDNNTLVSTDGFHATFKNCSSLTSIPAGLFDNNTLVSDNGFSNTFAYCSSLTSIPEGLFDNNTLVSTDGFYATFTNCSSLTSIPAGLFDNNLQVTSFRSCFQNCSSLTGKPAILWTRSPEPTGTNCYAGCTSLTALPYIPSNWGGGGQTFVGPRLLAMDMTTSSIGLADITNSDKTYVLGFAIDSYSMGDTPTIIETGLIDNKWFWGQVEEGQEYYAGENGDIITEAEYNANYSSYPKIYVGIATSDSSLNAGVNPALNPPLSSKSTIIFKDNVSFQEVDQTPTPPSGTNILKAYLKDGIFYQLDSNNNEEILNKKAIESEAIKYAIVLG